MEQKENTCGKESRSSIDEEEVRIGIRCKDSRHRRSDTHPQIDRHAHNRHRRFPVLRRDIFGRGRETRGPECFVRHRPKKCEKKNAAIVRYEREQEKQETGKNERPLHHEKRTDTVRKRPRDGRGDHGSNTINAERQTGLPGGKSPAPREVKNQERKCHRTGSLDEGGTEEDTKFPGEALLTTP